MLQRAPDGTITSVVDASGDGLGHPLQGANELAIGADGSVYVTGVGSRNVFKRTPGGTITQLIDATGDGAGNALQYPHGLAVDAAGNALVSDPIANRVFRIDPAGSVTSILDATGDGAGHTLSEPGAMVADPAGNLYVAGERSHNVFRVSPAGAITEVANASAPLDFPTALALDAAGNLYVGDFGDYDVLRVSPGGMIAQVARGVDPVALAVRSDGVLLIAESNGRRISGVRPSGPVCRIIDQSGDGIHPFGFASRFALTAGGTVFATNVSFDGVFQIENGCPAAPSVDAGGRWRVSVAYPLNSFFPPPPPSSFLQDWTQSGFDLAVSDPATSAVTFTGAIDDRNQFFLASVALICVGPSPGLCCPAQSLDGDVAAGGQGWLGSLTDNFFVPRFQCGGGPFPPATAFGSRCGNGVLDPGETCDDGNWIPGDGCDAACGMGSLCGNGVVEPDEGCDDGNRIARDGCSQTCQVEYLCGDGVLDAGEACDDGNLASGDGCDAQCRVEPCYQCAGSPSQCGPAVLTCGGATGSRGATLALGLRSSSRPPSLRWQVARGSGTDMVALGDPTTQTDYHLCVFDRSGAAPRVLMHIPLPAGLDWGRSATGFTYRTPTARLRIRAGAVGKIDARIRSLAPPAPPLPVPLTVQLQTSDAGCFDARFSSMGVVRNDVGGFRAFSDP